MGRRRTGERDGRLHVLWEDGERVFCRTWRERADGDRQALLAVLPAGEPPTSNAIHRLIHEYELRDHLDSAWALRPLELVRESGRIMLVLEAPDGEPIHRLLGPKTEVGRFLRLAIALSAALCGMHERGLVHKDIKPSNILVGTDTGKIWLTGFGIASRLPRERQPPEPPEFIAGTLAYMAPEQTGKMNRSIDSRSDLYALGVTFYQILTGSLPFHAADAMEWIHCHIARRPASATSLVPGLPLAISAIIAKLLAKAAEDRYQTAIGLQKDLERCLADWETVHRVDPFPLGEHDFRGRLLIPEKLYGRERDINTLLAAFDSVLATGGPELVLVSGYSGIGKSAVVNELHKVLALPRGLFASGKFDQYKRDIPYGTFAEAFQSILRQLLGQTEAELNRWRDNLAQALDPNGLLITDLIPELKLIIGEQPAVPELPPQDAKVRFDQVFSRFISVFARPEHPLALFLDDLQWLDSATLDLIENLLTQSDVRHLLLIGAYRDNEVDPAHPLMRRLEAIRQSGVKPRHIILAPLSAADLTRLVTDSFGCEPNPAEQLARLIYEKTAGNPFFVVQFITALADEGLIVFDYADARWRWDLSRIDAKGYTRNVVDLMVGKLNRLPIETQEALQQLSCLGNSAAIASLSMICQSSEENLHADMWEARRAELVVRSEGAYKFAHDRVHEAAYSLMPEAKRAEVHLRIGRLLVAHTPPERREEAIFEIVSQFARGVGLITSREERESIAELNLMAGKRAKGSAAYVSALTYLKSGVALLTEDGWERQPRLMFTLELNRAECEYSTGQSSVAEERLATLAKRATTTVEQAMVASLHIDVCTALDQAGSAVDVCLAYLRHVGIEWSPHPQEEETRREFERIWSLLDRRTMEDLIDLPLMEDAASLAIVDVLAKVLSSAWHFDANLTALTLCKRISLSLEWGNCDSLSQAYVVFGALVGQRFGDYQAGFRFARLGCDLIDRRGLKRFEARTHMGFGSCVLPWTRHVRDGNGLLRQALQTATKMGDLNFVGYSGDHLTTNLLAAGDPLDSAQRETENGLAFAQRARFGSVIYRMTSQLQLIRTLRGLTPTFGSFDDEQFNEIRIERHLSGNSNLAMAACCYWIRKLQARFIAGDYATAVDAASKAKSVLGALSLYFHAAEYHFYGALAQAAHCDYAPPEERQQHLDALTEHHNQLQIWAAHCPENFQNRAALVGAEIARIEGRALDAMALYEQAIRSARANDFVHNEAIAYEVSARFYAGRGFEEFARANLQKAHYLYQRWGADGKVRQLDHLYPQLRVEEPPPGPSSTIVTPAEHLDLATVIKVSQAVSGEIVLEKLLDTLMRTAIAQAGAERGLLILRRGNEQLVVAEATTEGDTVLVHQREQPLALAALPVSIIHFVVRVGDPVLLDDASARNPFGDDEYTRQRQARSILCLPLINQSKLVGVIYLENNLAPRVFTPARMAVLKLLASQAAIAVENASLYRDVAEREAKIRRLVDANIIGTYIWKVTGQSVEVGDATIVDANDAFLRMIGYDREDLAAGLLSKTFLSAPEGRDRDADTAAEVNATGAVLPFEKEYLRKDGTRVPVLMGLAAFDERRAEGFAFVVDLTERKRVEAEARENERRYREVQAALAHAGRVATMGQITASIAHEVSQPVSGAITNAHTALGWLSAPTPDLREATQALHRIIRDGNRAREVIERTRALATKAPARRDLVELNSAVREIIELTRSEAIKNRVTARLDLVDGLLVVLGDRVQLQQVVLNLIVNAIEAMSGASDGPRDLLVTTGKAAAGDVLVVVQDFGPGLTEQALSRLFDPFHTTKPGGLGLGLSICRSIIEAHGGRLWAAADVSRGAVFQFSIPGAETGGIHLDRASAEIPVK